MSFREIRNLVEHLRLLGFSRLVSLENFSSPNFQLVSEILTWTMMTVDSDYDLPTNIDSEQDRVIMVRLAAIFFYQKLGVRLNTVKLYGADKLAVQELLKITKSLCEATQLAVYPAVVSEEALPVQTDFSAAVSVKELREVRQLASNIVMDAASLSSILQREVDDKVVVSKRLVMVELI
ncbi:clusterin-associated protein 1-like [Panulirus ornatus]|uniref:clusterin-associated protein 1-like n=1 Tax=Panulirus ornatus TaxID=150431 RepID=UPI003A873284